MTLVDIQSEEPYIKNIKINKVGINNLKVPIFISQKIGGYQHSVANVNCYIDLDANKKGINMSRIPISIMKFLDQPLNKELLYNIIENVRLSSESNLCELSYEFPYFIKKLSPINKEIGVIHYDVIFGGTIDWLNDFSFNFKVRIPVTSLCPCSKEISNNGGAHNQKCYITIEIYPLNNNFIWIEDIIKLGEESSSCEIYSVLKRSDEAYVTDKAYQNPKFVEDIARECFYKLNNRTDIEKFKIKVESDESIHVHTAVALLESL